MGEPKSTTVTPFAVISKLLSLGRLGTDGTAILRPRGPVEEGNDGPVVRLRFLGGLLVDLETEGMPSLLERSLTSSPRIRDRDLKKLRREVQSTGADLGQCIISAGILDDQEIARCIIESLDRELAPLFTIEDPVLDERPDSTFHAGLLGCIDLSLPIDEAILRSAAAANRWDCAREMPITREVYGATSLAMDVFRDRSRYPEDAALLERFDGRLDLAEAIESGEADRWQSLSRARELIDGGYLEPTNPVQLFQMAAEEDRLGATEKALRLFLHAEELGLDDFDLGHKLAEVLEKAGRVEEALSHYLAFAEKCVSQFRIEDTIGVYAQILELDPENLEIREKYLSLLARYGRGDEALASGVELAKRLEEAGEENRARSLLEQLAEQAESNEEVLRLYRDLCLKTSDPEGATNAAKKLGTLYLERGEFETALEVYQELFFKIGDDSGVRARLVELHFRLGNGEKAQEHLTALHERSGWNSRQPSEEAIAFHRRLLDLNIEDAKITAWLSESAKGQESREDSVHYLIRHRDLLRDAGDLEGARLAAAELVRMRPDDVEATRTLSELERRCGHVGRAGVVFEELLMRLSEQESKPSGAEWRALVAEALEAHPTSTIARRLLLETLEEGAEPELRERLAVEGALLAVLSGDLERARSTLGSVQTPPPLASVIELCGGMLVRGGRSLGEPPEEFFRRGAHHAIDTGDRGMLLDLIDRLEAVAPEDPEVGKLRHAADRLRQSDGSTMGRSPQVVKSSISGITQKLRGLKDPSASGGTQVGGGVNAALAKLKGLQGGGGAPAPAPAPIDPSALGASPPAADGGDDPAPLPPPPKPSAAGGGVNAALARLKGLKGGGSPAPTPSPAPSATPGAPTATLDPPSGDDPAPLPPPPEPSAAGGGVNAALARLKGLGGLGGGSTPAPVADSPTAESETTPETAAPAETAAAETGDDTISVAKSASVEEEIEKELETIQPAESSSKVTKKKTAKTAKKTTKTTKSKSSGAAKAEESEESDAPPAPRRRRRRRKK